jgi:hypothetical protein
VVSDNRPNVRAQHHQSNFPPFEGLLVHDILISRYHNVKAGGFCCLEKFTIADACPTAVFDRLDLVTA